jgi:hypothetical protein
MSKIWWCSTAKWALMTMLVRLSYVINLGTVI